MKIEEFIRKYGTDIAVGDMPATMPLKSRDISFGEAAEKNTAEIIRLQKLLETVENETARKRIQNDLDKLLKNKGTKFIILPDIETSWIDTISSSVSIVNLLENGLG